jgi:putative endonuclease
MRLDASKQARGRWGEDRAARHLRRLGYRIVDRNWRAPERTLRGEIDLVAWSGGPIVFCEVKARRHAGHGGAIAAVDGAKQQRIRLLAESWLRHHGTTIDGWDGVRFDVITIEGVALRHWEAAF